MDSLRQWKTNSCLGFFPLESGVYLIFMVMFCSLILQTGAGYQTFPFEGMNVFLKFVYFMPAIFLVAAVIGIYGLIKGGKEFLLPVLIMIVISIIVLIAAVVNEEWNFNNHKNSKYMASILILPYAYFGFVIFSLYLKWS